eukprot:8419286-Alexandrium_andersonii.AAC.1
MCIRDSQSAILRSAIRTLLLLLARAEGQQSEHGRAFAAAPTLPTSLATDLALASTPFCSNTASQGGTR